ncbi:CD225/dispanin family protein [uncultured Muribaculum sp.]|uniref:CD225/dispanin family protein n=1 Tax=uncultured Muribaculum sp. TaxID=1918613 RepID=UPI0026E0CC3D|nr:CD225/dispanin family protein [uncultured Muribaculum sp.]
MEYWAIINNVQVGPMSPANIARMGLTPDTMVWCNGMDQWIKARYVPDFATYMPPAYAPGTEPAARQEQPSPPNYIVWSVISILLCCQVTGAIALIYSILVEYRYSNGNIDGAWSASRSAKTWNIVSIVLILIWLPLIFVTGLLNGLMSVF